MSEENQAFIAPSCLSCGQNLVSTTVDWLFRHESVLGDCAIILCDQSGASVDSDYELVDGVIYEREAPDLMAVIESAAKRFDERPLSHASIDAQKELSNSAFQIPADLETIDHLTFASPGRMAPLSLVKKAKGDFFVDLEGNTPTWTSFDEARAAIFEEANVPVLGGASGDLGWSGFATFQRCPHLWKRSYVDRVRGGESQALVVGSGMHLFRAIQCQQIIDPNFPLDPDYVYKRLIELGCNQEWINESWRIFSAYRVFYAIDGLVPLAVEYHVVDPTTNESCRFDLIAKLDKPWGAIQPGVFIVEMKTTSRFDDASLTGWRGDGEIFGQVMLWHRAKLGYKFGKLSGLIVDLVGKHKDPQFTRIGINVMPWQLKAHARDLQQWNAIRNLMVVNNSFPRARASCLTRFGKCSLWHECADLDREIK